MLAMKSTHRHSPPDSRRLRQSLGNLPEPAGPARPLQLCAPRLGHCQRAQCPRSVPARRTASRRKKGPGPQGQTRVQGGLATPLLRARGRARRGPGPPAFPPGSPAGEPAARCNFAGCVPLGPAREPRPATSLSPFSPSPSPVTGELWSPAAGRCSRRGGGGRGCPGGAKRPSPKSSLPCCETNHQAICRLDEPRPPCPPITTAPGGRCANSGQLECATWSKAVRRRAGARGEQMRTHLRLGSFPSRGRDPQTQPARPPLLLLADTDCNLIFQSLGN